MNKKFTKADLKDGMIVTYRHGEERTILGGVLYSKEVGNSCFAVPLLDISFKAQIPLKMWNVDLTYSENPYLDIVKVTYDGKVLWERKEIKLSDTERAWLSVAKHDGKRYIARDRDGRLYVYPERPNKMSICWLLKSDAYKQIWSGNLFEFITFDDDEPYSIEDLLKL